MNSNLAAMDATEFVTTCPEWCTLAARGLSHGSGIDESGKPSTWHEAQLSVSADFELIRYQEDRFVNGAIVSTASIRLVTPDEPDLTVEQVRLLAQQAALAADLMEAES